MSQAELFYAGPFVADSVEIEAEPVLCDDCQETLEDCSRCSNCEACSEACDCVMCARCEEPAHESDTETVYLGWNYTVRRTVSEEWCDSCAHGEAYRCDGCGDYHAGESYTQTCNDCSSTLCESCSESGYYCESCDNWSCCNNGNCCYSEFIAEYHKGNPMGIEFHGAGNWHMGIELELSADEYDAERLLNILGGNENVHFERDGSVNDGWEFIFQPRTLESWRDYAQSSAFGTLKRMAQGGEHGFHVHVSKTAFKSGNAVRRWADIMTGRSGDEAKSLLETLAGRCENSWAMFEAFPRKEVATKALKKGRYGQVGNYVPQRYRGAVNLNTGKPTFEVRLGSGTTNPVTVLAWLEFISAAVEWANGLTLALEALGGCDTLALIDYMADKPQYEHAYAAALLGTWQTGLTPAAGVRRDTEPCVGL